MAISFLHAADIHLDSPLKGLERYENAPVDRMRQATRRAFERLINLAIEKRVDFVVIAGDLYDGDCRDYNTGLYLTKQLGRLREEKIPGLRHCRQPRRRQQNDPRAAAAGERAHSGP